MPPILTPAEVRAAAERLPRVRLAHLPTPLEELPRFAAQIPHFFTWYNALFLVQAAALTLAISEKLTACVSETSAT